MYHKIFYYFRMIEFSSPNILKNEPQIDDKAENNQKTGIYIMYVKHCIPAHSIAHF